MYFPRSPQFEDLTFHRQACSGHATATGLYSLVCGVVRSYRINALR